MVTESILRMMRHFSLRLCPREKQEVGRRGVGANERLLNLSRCFLDWNQETEQLRLTMDSEVVGVLVKLVLNTVEFDRKKEIIK